MKYIIVADDTCDNQPLGIMFVETDDINATIQEVFANEPDCDLVWYEKLDDGNGLMNGVMMNWSGMSSVQREEDEE